MYANGYATYKNNSVNFASKEQLLLMLVDGGVKFAKRAEKALLEKNIPESHNNLMKTQDVFTELMASLDTDAGDWAKNMFKVYKFIHSRLVQANVKKDVKILREVMPLIIDVRDLWYEVYEKAKVQQA